MYLEGLKTLSHKTLVFYLEKNYRKFTKGEIILIDGLRKLRNNIEYYGQKVSQDYLVNSETQIKIIIKKLIKIVNEKLKNINNN